MDAACAGAQQPYEDGFLNVQAILRLIENDRVQRVNDLVGHFASAMGRQAMHKSERGERPVA